MAIDSIIFKVYQGEEEDLEDRIFQFINNGPPKRIANITSWTIGITVYIMVLYELLGTPQTE